MLEEVEEGRSWLPASPTVTAILVSHDGAAWLPKVLSSISVMDYAPTSWRVVDVSSTDGSAELLRDSFGTDRMAYAPSGTGFGAAVKLGIESAPPSDWIWLLHDDCIVVESTLAALLDEALSDDRIAIVGPKVREWPSLRRLLEVGVTMSGTAGRVTGLEPGEPDAGQHDRPRDVLAVGSAGMLVRRDAWEDLGGFDDSLPLYFDDVDLGWRAARAGYRVRTAPRALIFHAEASARGNRRVSAGDVPDFERRRAALYTALANVSRRAFWWQAIRLFFGSLLRALGLVAKAPEAAGDELLAIRSVYLHPGRLRAARARRAVAARIDSAAIGPLLPSRWLPYQHGFDSLRDVIATIMAPTTLASEGKRASGRRSSAFEQTPESARNMAAGPNFLARRPWLAVVIVLSTLSLIAARGLLTGAPLHGGALLAAPETAGGWWRLFFERWHDVGIGSDVAAPPYTLALGLMALPVWFAPGAVVSLLMLGSVPLAALTAHRLSGRWFSAAWIRMLWAITYGLIVVSTGAVAQGRLGTVTAMIVAPIAVGAACALVDRPTWQAGLRLGLWLALMTAFAPVTLLLGLVLIAVLAAISKEHWTASGIAVLVPVVLTGSWMWQRVAQPFHWWWEAGLADADVGSLRVAAWELLLGRAGGPGAAPAWLCAGILILGVAALFSRRRTTAVTWCWGVALLGFIMTVAGNSMTFSPPPGPSALPVWNGVGAVVWLGGLAAAAMFVIDDLTLKPPAHRHATHLVRFALVVALIAPVGIGGWWLVRGLEDPLSRDQSHEVPAYLAARSDQRTLVLDGSISSGIGYDVVVEGGLRLGQEAVQPPTDETAGVTDLIESLLSNPTDRALETLSSYDITAIYAPADVDNELARRLDSVPGLEPSGSDDPDSRVWLLKDKASIIDRTGTTARWLIAGLNLLLVVVAVILTAPVRQRRRQL